MFNFGSSVLVAHDCYPAIGGQEQGMVWGLLGLLSPFKGWFNNRTLRNFEKKHPVSDLVLTAATIKTVKMLCHTVNIHTVCTQKCFQDGVGPSPGSTINSWKKTLDNHYCTYFQGFWWLLQSLLMYSARCRRPWGTSRTDQDDDQALAQLRREIESHRG